MRLWSIHPSYLDTKGLVAVWREGLLALHVLNGKTKGYTNHPQLIRFKNHPQPLAAITNYLHVIADEADRREYHFNRVKLTAFSEVSPILVTSGQIAFEIQHLKQKLLNRDTTRYTRYESQPIFDPHPLFTIVPGQIENWEKVTYDK